MQYFRYEITNNFLIKLKSLDWLNSLENSSYVEILENLQEFNLDAE